MAVYVMICLLSASLLQLQSECVWPTAEPLSVWFTVKSSAPGTTSGTEWEASLMLNK